MLTKLAPFFGAIGKKTEGALVELARMFELVQSFFQWAVMAPLKGKRSLRRESFAHQLIFMGNESFFIVFLVSLSVGAVLALQAAYQLQQFGALLYTGALVSVSMSRELGPIVTAIVLAGRVGASITAEIGTMKVQEEVDALTTMGIPPVPYLVVPRILALTVMLPCLTIMSFAIGILGGYLIGVVSLGIDSNLYLKAGFDALASKDLYTGIVKSFVFALLVGLISTYNGLAVEGGAEGVGKATTKSVVSSIIAIILADGICTAIFFYVFP